MTDTTGLERVWGLTGAETDPGKTGYEEGWQAEIPTFQEFNFVLAALDRAKLSFAEKDIHRWQEGINYIAGARVEDDEKTFYCTTPHDGTSNPQKPSDDNTNSYWVNGVVFGGLVDAFTNLRAHDGVLIDDVQTRSTDDKWEGNDLTIRNKTNITAYTTSSSSHDNLLFGNVRGKLVVVNVANQSQPDERTITAGAANNSYEIFHEGHQPNVTEVVNALEKNPVDGIMYARRNNTWVEVTTTTVGATPPAAAKGAGASWYNLEDGRLYVDIYDGDSSQWVPASPPVVPELVASGISYDKTLVNELVATQVQQAIDELASRKKVVNPNLLMNGDFSLWQRSTNATSTSALDYIACDRWFASREGVKIERQTLSNGHEEEYQAAVTTGTIGYAGIGQRIERSKHLQSTQVTISFSWLQPTGDNIKDAYVVLTYATPGTLTRGNASYKDIPDATESGRKEITLTVPDSDNEGDVLELSIYLNKATANGEYVALRNVKLETGTEATEFVPDDPATNLAKCQRYYEELVVPFVATNNSTSMYQPTNANFKVTKRGAPDCKIFAIDGTPDAVTIIQTSNSNVGAVTGLNATTQMIYRIACTGLTKGEGYHFRTLVDAEL